MNRPFRKLVILIAALVSLAYLTYRIGWSLNLTTTYSTFASLLLLVGEAFGIVSILLYFFQIWDPNEPAARPVLPNRSVDVFVPTYNEDLSILRATLEACVRMDYEHRTFLCDDGGTDQRCNDSDAEKAQQARTRKAALISMCAELGVTYLTRPANVHAKAGNLNEAFAKTDGEFIVIFDADHVPERRFITRLIGYFEDARLGYVQTPHAFYNFESFQALLDHKNRRYWEEAALFYGLIQPGRNRWGCPIFAGSAAMFRREAMKEVGYIATETITEDMHTGMRINAKGWKSLAISERMVAGQAAPDITTYHSQRLRWGEGNLSIMAYDFPLTMRGLSLGQRICYLGSMVHWAGGFFKLFIYLTPILMMLTGVPPVKELTLELALVTMTYLLASVLGVFYVSNRLGSVFYGELFCMVGFWTQIRATCRALFWRKFQSFVVTSKRGRQAKSVWPYIRPHLVLGALSFLAVSWGWSRIIFGVSDDFFKPLFPSFWIMFHLWLIALVVGRALWPEDRRYSYRHQVNLHVEYEQTDDQMVVVPSGSGVTIDLNETGFSFMAYDVLPPGVFFRFRLHGGNECVGGLARVVTRTAVVSGTPGLTLTGYRYGVTFADLPAHSVDSVNRIALQYAVPRLYQVYQAGNLRGPHSALTQKLTDRRGDKRKPFRLPVRVTLAGQDASYAVTEDVSARAAAILLEREVAPGVDVQIRLGSPLGDIQATGRAYRVEPRLIGHHHYHRAVFTLTSFAADGQQKYFDLIGYRKSRSFRDVVAPEKKPLRVRLVKPMVTAALAASIVMAIQLGTFPRIYRDELFLHRLALSTTPASPDDVERYERIYESTMAQSYPSNDRLVLLMGCLPKVNNFEGRDELTRFLASRDRGNVDLQLALAGTLDKTQDYSQAEAEFRRLFEMDRKGRLPESRRRDLLLASARSAVHRADLDAAAERFQTFLRTYPDQTAVRNEYAGVMIQAGRYKDVPVIYAQAPADYDGHLLLMSAYALDKDFDKAEAESRALLQLRPDDPKAGRLLADLLTYRKNYQQSKDLYERLLRENQDDPEIRLKLGQIHLANNHFDDALIQFQTVIDRGSKRPDAVKGFLDAAASAPRLSAHNQETARRQYDTMQADPHADPVYLARLGWVLERIKEPARSLELVQRAMNLKPDNKEIKKQYFSLLVAQGHMNEALAALGAERSDPSVRRLLVDVYLRSGDFASATTELRALSEAQPDDNKLKRLLADVLSWKKDYAGALAAFEKLRQANPSDETIPIRIAEVTHWSGDSNGALVLYETMLAARFDRPEAWRGFVDAAADAPSLSPSQFRLAVRIAEQPGSRDSGNVPFLARLAWVFIREKQPDYAAPLLDQALKLPAEPSPRKELAGVLSAAGRYKEALAQYEDLQPEGEDHLHLAEIYAALKDHDAAAKECNEYLREKPGDPKGERLLADVLSWKKDYSGSLTMLRKLQRLYPENDELSLRVAEVTLWSGKPAVAFDQFEKLLRKRPGDSRVASGYIECCAAADKLTPAQIDNVARLLGTKAFDPADAAAQVKLAVIFYRAGDKPEGEKHLSTAIALNPTEAATRKQLGVLLLSINKPMEALKWFEGIKPNFDDRITLAMAYCAAKQFVQAEEHAREALRLKPNDPRAERLLADVLSWKGDYKEALGMLAAMHQKTPADPELATRLAEVTLWSGDAQGALWLFQDLLEKKFDQPRLWVDYVDAAASAPKLTPAQLQLTTRIYQSSHTTDPAEPAFLARLAWIMYQAGHQEDSAKLIDRALGGNLMDAALRREVAGICGLLGRGAQALKLYDGLELSDVDRERLVGLYASTKDYVSAEQTVRKLLAGKPNDPKLMQLLGDVLSWKGEYTAALEIYQQLRAARPDDDALDLRIAETLQASGESAAALAKYEARLTAKFEQPETWRRYLQAAASLEKLKPASLELVRRIGASRTFQAATDPIESAHLAVVLNRAHDPNAKQLLDRLAKLDVKDPLVRRELAGTFASAGRAEQALAFFKGLDLAGEDLLTIANVHAALKDYPSALKACRAYVAANPNDDRGDRLLADLLSWSGSHDEAIAAFDRLKKAQPTDLSLAVRAAETTMWAGRQAEAMDRFAAVLDNEPGNASAAAGFVCAAFEAPKLSVKQQQIFDRLATTSITTNPDALVLARAGVVLQRLGRPVEADRLFDRAASLMPSAPLQRRLLGGLFALAGKSGRAEAVWSGLPFSADESLELARLFAAGRDYKAALKACNAVLARSEKNFQAERLLADLLGADKQYSAALALLKKLQIAAPADVELNVRRAEVTLASGDSATAIGLFQKELERDPERPRLWTGFVDAAAAAQSLNSTQKAFVVRSFEKTNLKNSSDPAFITRFAWLMVLADRPADAAKLAEKALSLNPEESRVRKDLGGVFLALGNDKLAAAMYQGLKLDSDDQIQLVNIHSSKKDFAGAEKQARALLVASPEDPKLLRMLADILSWKGDYKGSLELFIKLRTANPDSLDLKTRVAEVKLWSGDRKGAAEEFATILEKDFDHPRLWTGFVDAASGLKQVGPREVALAERILGAMPADEPLTMARLALVLDKGGRNSSAQKLVEKCLTKLPQDPASRKELAGLLAALGCPKKALELFEGMTLTPDDRITRIGLFGAMNDLPGAEREARQMVTAMNNDPKALKQLAEVLTWRKDMKGAAEVYAQVAALSPNDPDLAARSAEIATWSGDYEAAASRFEALLSKDFSQPGLWPTFMATLANISDITPKQKAIAEKIVAEVARKDSEDVRYLSNIAWVLCRLERKTDGVKFLDRAVALKPTDPGQRKTLAGVLEVFGRNQEALQMFEGVTLEVGDHLQLAGLYSAGKQYELALKQIRAALAEDQKNRKASRMLADVLSWKGDYPNALAEFDKLAKDAPDDPEIPIRVAEVTLWSKNYRQATALYQSLLDADFERPKLWIGFVDSASSSPKLSSSNEKTAAKILDRVVDEKAKRPLVFWCRTAWILGQFGDKARQQVAVDRAIALASTDPSDRKELAAAVSAAGRYKEALALYAGLELNTNDHLHLAGIHAAMKNYDAADEELRLARINKPTDAPTLHLMADVLSWSKHYKEASEIFQSLLAKDPDNTMLAVKLANVQLWAGNFDNSVSRFVAILDKDFDQPLSWASFLDAVAAARTLDGKPARAIVAKIHDRVLSDHSSDIDLLTRLGVALTKVGEPEKGLSILKKALDSNPASREIKVRLASALSEAGKYDEAEAIYRTLLRESPRP